MPTEREILAKQVLDTVIRKSRVHLYKPIQVAKILFHHRTERGWKKESRVLLSYGSF